MFATEISIHKVGPPQDTKDHIIRPDVTFRNLFDDTVVGGTHVQKQGAGRHTRCLTVALATYHSKSYWCTLHPKMSLSFIPHDS